MKKLLLYMFVFSIIISSGFAQFGLGERLKRKVEEKIERKTEEAVERAMEKPFEEQDDDENQDEEESQPNQKKKQKSNESSKSSDDISAPSMQTYSKFDFIAGDRIIFFEDFSQDAVGDFPVNWNTNGSGEVVTTNLYPGKWLKMTNQALYVPDLKQVFPENFTIEFDVLASFADELERQFLGYCRFEILQMDNIKNSVKTDYLGANGLKYNAVFDFDLQFDRESRIFLKNMVDGDVGGIDNQLNGTWLRGYHRKPIHFSISVNKQRMRIWINESKVFDIPRMMDKDAKYNLIRFFPNSLNVDYDYSFMISNIKIAEGVVDSRSKLLTEGKLVTNAITFDTGSDKIKPESYSMIKSIADVLVSNPEVKILIVGHTDSDGNATKNQALSESRAAAVKNSLITDFGINDSRISTSGKGDKESIADNNTSEGKAKNRRVEFVKQ